MKIREGRSDEHPLLAAMFRQMWIDAGVGAEDIVEDWQRRVEQFVGQAQAYDFRFFVAEVEGEVSACAACQRFQGLYPDILAKTKRNFGYIWGVFVDRKHRRQGLGKQLTERCITTLEAIGCTHAVLHAAPMGLGVYRDLEFRPTNEMRLDLAR